MRIKVGKKTFHVKDCRGISCIRGLMFDGMEDIDGALVYGNSMWMPFVKHELDLFFLDKEMKIVAVKNAIPLTFNPKAWKSYSCKDAKYCLEMKKGVCKAKTGQRVILSGLGRN